MLHETTFPFPSFPFLPNNFIFLPFHRHHRHPFGFFLHKLAFKFILTKKQIFIFFVASLKTDFLIFFLFHYFFSQNFALTLYVDVVFILSFTMYTEFVYNIFIPQRSQRSRRDDTFSIFFIIIIIIIIYFLQFINK